MSAPWYIEFNGCASRPRGGEVLPGLARAVPSRNGCPPTNSLATSPVFRCGRHGEPCSLISSLAGYTSWPKRTSNVLSGAATCSSWPQELLFRQDCVGFKNSDSRRNSWDGIDCPEAAPRRKKFRSVDSREIRCLDEGQGDETLLCVRSRHGALIAASSSVFCESHRVITIKITSGGVARPSRAEFPYRLSDHRDNLVSLIDQLDLHNITLIAHDWGGAALRFTDRTRGLF